jgi:hypothetical protein
VAAITVENISNLFSTALNAGTNLTNVTLNFFRVDTGYSATSANNSNFIGNQAGYSATSASNSNFIGYQAGYRNKCL